MSQFAVQFRSPVCWYKGRMRRSVGGGRVLMLALMRTDADPERKQEHDSLCLTPG